jgi:hypothetical protein
MGNAGHALDGARSWLGFVEGPGINETLFGQWSGFNFQPWCASFASYVLDQAGTSIGKMAYVPTVVVFFRDQGRLFTTPVPGDVFNVWFPLKNRYAHCGFVEKVDGDYIVTVEGNTNVAGSRTGGGVFRLRRLWRGTKMVFGRPNYTGTPIFVPVPPPPGPFPFEEVHVAVTIPRSQGGYAVLKSADGGVFAYDNAPFFGSLPGIVPGGVKVVDLAWTPTGLGYWILGADGAIFAFGDAVYKGALNNVDFDGDRLPIGIVAKDAGYIIVTLDPSGDNTPFDPFFFP